MKILSLVGISLLAVLPPLLAGYSLLRGRRWAKGVVLLTCLIILMLSLVVLIIISWPKLSTNRIFFGILYGGASMALCLYGIWFLRKQTVV